MYGTPILSQPMLPTLFPTFNIEPNYEELEFDLNRLESDWELDRNLLGSGRYGKVYKAHYRDGSKHGVAIKRPNSQVDRGDLANELRVLAFLPPHVNIVSLVGAVYGPNFEVKHLVLELCDCSLDEYLQSTRDTELERKLKDGRKRKRRQTQDMDELADIAIQIATGMDHLTGKGIVHGDLTQKNVLLIRSDGRALAKITDFGLTRPKYYKLCDTRFDWQMLILPPESILIDETGVVGLSSTFKLSYRSDVWAFGCLLHSLFNYGRPPYDFQMTIKQFRTRPDLRKGPAVLATEEIHQIMIACWNLDSGARISFLYLKGMLQSLQHGSKTKAALSTSVDKPVSGNVRITESGKTTAYIGGSYNPHATEPSLHPPLLGSIKCPEDETPKSSQTPLPAHFLRHCLPSPYHL